MLLSFVARKLAKRAVSSASKKLVKKAVTKKALSAAQKRALAKAVKASAMARKKLAAPKIGKIRAYRIKKVQARIKANDLKLKSLKKGTRTVYRVQNKKGEGPLMGANVKHYAQMPLSIPRGVKVAPVSNFNRRRAALLKKLAPKGTKFEEIKFSGKDKFAFDSIKQSQKYFSKQEQAYLKTKGFNLVSIQNAKVIGATNTQVSYRIPKGLSSSAKEATALADYYKKLTKQW